MTTYSITSILGGKMGFTATTKQPRHESIRCVICKALGNFSPLGLPNPYTFFCLHINLQVYLDGCQAVKCACTFG